jgi:GT2 family glycosyltransferase
MTDHHGCNALLILDERLDLPSEELLRRLLDGPADAWHGGISLGLDGAPPIVDHVNPTWMLNVRTDPSIEITSWRASLRAVLLRGEVLRRCGTADPELDTLSGAALDLGFRWIAAGAIVRSVPELVSGTTIRDPWPSEGDGVRILRRHRGRTWAIWATLRSATTGRVGWADALRLVRIAGSAGPGPQVTYRGPARPPGRTDRRVSVIVPTIDRYPYLLPLLTQLGRQTVPVHEVIVVDQTPAERRRSDLGADLPHLPLTVIGQDEPGQCTARNAAILASSGDALLFIDDDDEIPDDLVEQHLRRLVPGVDASCGGIDDANAGPPPEGFRARRVSDVFPTNNVMVRRTALEHSGLFDPAYDRGPRADHDVGMRLHLNGCVLVYDPTVLVFHHHAQVGGLRTHRARRVTRAAARRSLTARHLPSTTEVYLWRRYFDARQVDESAVLSLFGQLGGSGSKPRRALRAAVQIALLPGSRRALRATRTEAERVLADRPVIPDLPRQPAAPAGSAQVGT